MLSNTRPHIFTLQVLWLVPVVAGIILRFAFIDTIEFKSDEFNAMVLAYLNIHGDHGLVQAGLQSSMGIYNPPFFLYLLSPAMLVTQSPIGITLWIALLNTAGIIFLWLFLRNNTSENAAIWTTALLSTAPWAIIYSRKIWAQDALLPFLILLYATVFSLRRDYRSWKVIVIAVLLAIVTQLHMSAWFLPIGLIVFFILDKTRFRARDIALGAATIIIIYLPYIRFLIRTKTTHIADALSLTNDRSSDIIGHLMRSPEISSGLNLPYLIGSDAMQIVLASPLMRVAWMIMIVSAIAMSIAFIWLLFSTARKSIYERTFENLNQSERIFALLSLIYIGVMASYILLRVPALPHYHILFYPLFPFAFAFALYMLSLRGIEVSPALQCGVRCVAHGIILTIVLAQLALSSTLLSFINRHPEAIGGDYGVPYRLKRDVWERELETRFREIRRNFESSKQKVES